MEKTPDQRRDILRKFMADNNLQPAGWAKASGVDKNSIYNFLNGESQSLHARTYAKLARTAGVPTWHLTGDEPDMPSPSAVWVRGEVQAGAFKEAVEWDRDEWFPVDVPVPSRFQGVARALKVAGPSMNKEFREGSVVIWVKVLDFRSPRDEDYVIVYSYRRDDTVEATLKQLRVLPDGTQWLWPQSDHPAHQAPINPSDPPEDIKDIEVIGIVIGDYRPRHH